MGTERNVSRLRDSSGSATIRCDKRRLRRPPVALVSAVVVSRAQPLGMPLSFARAASIVTDLTHALSTVKDHLK